MKLVVLWLNSLKVIWETEHKLSSMMKYPLWSENKTKYDVLPGTVLGPNLLILYINDIVQYIKNASVSETTGIIPITQRLYHLSSKFAKQTQHWTHNRCAKRSRATTQKKSTRKNYMGIHPELSWLREVFFLTMYIKFYIYYVFGILYTL